MAIAPQHPFVGPVIGALELEELVLTGMGTGHPTAAPTASVPLIAYLMRSAQTAPPRSISAARSSAGRRELEEMGAARDLLRYNGGNLLGMRMTEHEGRAAEVIVDVVAAVAV